MPEKLFFEEALRRQLRPYLPQAFLPTDTLPFVTLTYAASLDSQIAITPGQRTPISGPTSKSMTHFLRSMHDAILVGSGTALADNPALNSRLDDALDEGLARQPQPVIVDRRHRWLATDDSNVVQAARHGHGKPPWHIVGRQDTPATTSKVLEAIGGKYLEAADFPSVLKVLADEGIRSVMVEGGAALINHVLSHHKDLVNVVIVTLGSLYFGEGGVVVSPARTGLLPAVKFVSVKWVPMDEDVVMCGRISPS